MSLQKSIQSLVVMCRRLDLLHGGASLRNWQNVQGLAKLGPVDVISIGPSDQPQAVPGVRHYQPFSRESFRAARSPFDRLLRKRWIVSATAHPMLETHYDAAVTEWIQQRIRQYTYDLVVVEELALARYVTALKPMVGATIFDAHNVESALHEEIGASHGKQAGIGILDRWKSSLLDRRLMTAERGYGKEFDRIWACSSVDQSGFNHLLDGAVPVDVIPNSIDVPGYGLAEQEPATNWSDQELTITYLGSYSYFPNEQAALLLINEVLPLLREQGISAKILLIGANPTESMKAAAGASEDVVITGKVDSILPYMKQPCVIVLPLRLGSGTRLKILEAFACSRPVISTAKGVEGIEAADGVHLLIRETAAEMASAAIEIWKNRDLRDTLCRNALELVSDRYSLQSAERLIRESVHQTLSAIR